jgi:carbamoyl-phosphate synthase small subunit
MAMDAVLVLEDGTIVEGTGFGAEAEVLGEVVFNTSMAGYQEALTDPSYTGQILMFTYPLVGNYGIDGEAFESDRVQVEGFVVREESRRPSHRSAKKTLHRFLEEHGVPGIAGVDTRALTRRIRKEGTMKGALKTSSAGIDPADLLQKARDQKGISERDLVRQVTCREVRSFEGRGRHVVLLDCGMKLSILRSLRKRDLRVTVVPATTPPKEVLALEPEGVVLSNGPGNPERAEYAVRTVEALLGELPLFGICLGHQLMALAAGAQTYKLKFGHRGANQPVKDLATGRVCITSQNHGFEVDRKTLEGTGFEVSHINLNDQTVEGMRHRDLPAFSVQYHPEAHPGPQENEYLFDEFLEMMEAFTR